MNLIAIDIGNTNISIALYLSGEEKSVQSFSGDKPTRMKQVLKEFWQAIPVLKTSKEKKRDGVVIASSVKPEWTQVVSGIMKEAIGEKLLIIGKDIPFPIELSIEEPNKVGTDRVICAAAAYAVAEQAVVVADFGTAVTIDLVDDRGVFVGGTIFPGFEISAKTLKENTAKLPLVNVTRPQWPFGKNTEEAINAGLYYSAVGALQEIIRRFAETIGTWPKTIITGAGAKIIIDDCNFIDSYVPGLVIKGIALSYKKYIEQKL